MGEEACGFPPLFLSISAIVRICQNLSDSAILFNYYNKNIGYNGNNNIILDLI